MKQYSVKYENPQGKKVKHRIDGSVSQRINALRLSDIAKLIHGRHGGACYDYEWASRYFYAALPHLIGSRIKWQDAVRAWVVQWAPAFLIEDDGAWIAERAALCFEKKRRFPSTDKLAKLLGVQPGEPDAFGLRTIPAMARPKAVRKKERAKASAARSRKIRAASNPDFKPREDTKAARLRAAGLNVNTEKSKQRRARIASEKAKAELPAEVIEAGSETVALAANDLVLTYKEKDIASARSVRRSDEDSALPIEATPCDEAPSTVRR